MGWGMRVGVRVGWVSSYLSFLQRPGGPTTGTSFGGECRGPGCSAMETLQDITRVPQARGKTSAEIQGGTQLTQVWALAGLCCG